MKSNFELTVNKNNSIEPAEHSLLCEKQMKNNGSKVYRFS